MKLRIILDRYGCVKVAKIVPFAQLCSDEPVDRDTLFTNPGFSKFRVKFCTEFITVPVFGLKWMDTYLYRLVRKT